MNLTLRPVRPEDLEAIHALNHRAERHDRVPVVTPIEEFRQWLDDPHLELESDTRVAEVAGEPAGWARVWHRPSAEREERAYLFGAVDPAHRGRGVGAALLRWELDRATALLRRSEHALPRYVRAVAYDFQQTDLRLYRRLGLEPVRYQDELLRPLESLPPPRAVDGVTIVPWDAARSEAARIALNDSFADHWGFTPRDRAAWEHDLAAYGSRPDLSFLALDADQVVGVCRNAHFPDDEAVTGRLDGWILQVGVVRSHRRRGIASALVVASLHAFRDAGLTHSALGVDSENPTGAYAIYERLGYRPMHRSVVHQLAL